MQITVSNVNKIASDQSQPQSVEAPGAPGVSGCQWCEKPLPDGRWKFCCAKCGHAHSNSNRNIREGRAPIRKPSPAQKAWVAKAEPPSQPGEYRLPTLRDVDSGLICQKKAKEVDRILARRAK